MELLSIAQRRARARQLIQDALARVEASGSATKPARMPAVIFLLAAAVTALFVGASSARALPAGMGVGCFVSEVAEPAAWIVLAGGLLALLAFADPRSAGRQGSAGLVPFGYVC